jgi:hypothetical protein
MDFDLLERIGKVQHLEPFVSLKTKVIAPIALCEYLGLTPIPTTFLSYHSASFPVRPDLHQPGSRRVDWPKKQASGQELFGDR